MIATKKRKIGSKSNSRGKTKNNKVRDNKNLLRRKPIEHRDENKTTKKETLNGGFWRFWRFIRWREPRSKICDLDNPRSNIININAFIQLGILVVLMFLLMIASFYSFTVLTPKYLEERTEPPKPVVKPVADLQGINLWVLEKYRFQNVKLQYVKT